MKKIYYVFIFLICILFNINVSAQDVTGYVNTNDTIFTKSANVEIQGCANKVNGSYNSNYASPGKLHCLDSSDEIKIKNIDSVIASKVSSCSKGYYEATYTSTSNKTYTGYICADKVNVDVDTKKYENELKDFPSSYLTKLSVLKEAHPNWKFSAYKTNLNWNDVISAESVVGISYINTTDPIYLSLDTGSYDASTGKYIQKEAGGWYAANKKTVAYYMDPRNFLEEMNIFQFENLGYNPSYQTKEVVDSILNNTALLPYSQFFMDAATYNGNSISPIMLAARSRQEVVTSNGLSGSASGTYGYYNFYNLGAWSSCSNPVLCAIDFAKGYDEGYTTYNRPWDTAEKAIKNGASYIANGYINRGQNTLYFQKFNVTSNNTYSHQYMNNIQAALSEGKNTWKSYKNMNVLSNPIEFLIPVYENMPGEASKLPTAVEVVPETNETVTIISDLLYNAGFKVEGNYILNISLNTKASELISKLKKDGVKVTIRTTDEQNITKEISGNEVIGTGDIIRIDNGTSTGEYRLVIKGDANGDGKITAVDYVKIKNNIMGSSKLVGSYEKAADANSDNKITAVDYVKIKNYIMNNEKI